ncbi:MAG: hypothetical protein WDO73_08810 [Ignavibacteriota bacterium]
MTGVTIGKEEAAAIRAYHELARLLTAPEVVDSTRAKSRAGRNRDIVQRWMDLSKSDDAVLYSPVSVPELCAGARPKEHEALKNLLLALPCAPIDEEAGTEKAIRWNWRMHCLLPVLICGS